MEHKDLFQNYFMPLFLKLALDPVKNVRIVVARVLEAHFSEKEGAFTFDITVNQAIKILKKDFCHDVRQQLEQITTYPLNDTSEVDVEKWREEIKKMETKLVDTDSESESSSSYNIDVALNNSWVSGPQTESKEEEKLEIEIQMEQAASKQEETVQNESKEVSES